MQPTKRTIITTIALLCMFAQGAWAQSTYIESSWDADNKQIVHTEKPIPNGAHRISEFAGGGTIENCWVIVDQSITITNALRCHDVHLVLCDGTTDSNVQSRRYNFSIERGKSKLSLQSVRKIDRRSAERSWTTCTA